MDAVANSSPTLGCRACAFGHVFVLSRVRFFFFSLFCFFAPGLRRCAMHFRFTLYFLYAEKRYGDCVTRSCLYCLCHLFFLNLRFSQKNRHIQTAFSLPLSRSSWRCREKSCHHTLGTILCGSKMTVCSSVRVFHACKWVLTGDP